MVDDETLVEVGNDAFMREGERIANINASWMKRFGPSRLSVVWMVGEPDKYHVCILYCTEKKDYLQGLEFRGKLVVNSISTMEMVWMVPQQFRTFHASSAKLESLYNQTKMNRRTGKMSAPC